MKKLLYITDQDEYVDHSFIAPLFEVYLKKYLTVDIVYFTDFKSDFARKDEHHFVVPSLYKNQLVRELKQNNVDMKSYDFVMVRNNISLLKRVLKYRKKYKYKALFRFSFPKRRVHIRCEEAEQKSQLINRLLNYFKTKDETKIINLCDAFLPTSKLMQETFRPDVNIPNIICSPAINPHALHENKHHKGKEIRFVYVGTLDKVREFNIVLEAFSLLKSDTWKLYISTRDIEFAHNILEDYASIQENIQVYSAKTKESLLNLIAKADIGIALLPDIPIYNTTTPVKVYDYYSSAVPCLMTHSAHTSTLFTDSHDVWFSDFSIQGIHEKIESILALSKEEVVEIGERGQKRLLEIKNYETVAEDIANQLNAL